MLSEHKAQIRKNTTPKNKYNSVTLFTGEFIKGNKLEIKHHLFSDYIKLDTLAFEYKEIESYTNSYGECLKNLKPARKNEFGIQVKTGRITVYKIYDYSNTFTKINGRYHQGLGSKTVESFYFEIKGQPIQFLNYKTITPILEQNPVCKNIVNQINKNRKSANKHFIASAIFSVSSYIFIMQSINSEEGNLFATTAGALSVGLTLTSGVIGLKKNKDNTDYYLQGIDAYNR